MSIRLLLFLCLTVCASAADSIFDQSNLAAWCIVPFDKAARGPEERAAMLEKMGVKKFVYDYRKEHIPQWDDELNALKKHHIELLGWWFPGSLNDEAKSALELFQRHGVHPQLWISGGGGAIAVKDDADQNLRVEKEAARFKLICEAAAPMGCKVGIYNHGGWGGEPENMIAVTEALKAQGISNIGIVYNLHHGHGHLDKLAKVLPRMLPHLLFLNLNGMDIDGEARGRKILPLGVGTEDVKVLRLVRASGYRGPVGILNHTGEDAEGRLLDNLDGLRWLLPQLDGAAPGPKPSYRTWSEAKAGKPAAANPQIRPPHGVPSLNELSPAPQAAPAVKAAEFSPERKPLRVEDNIHWQHFVNRDRVFDYYGKQAEHFMKQARMPELLPEFPGLDGGKQGHWGNQNDAVTWKDGRWAAADHGTVFSAVFKGAGLTIPKGVCVRYDDLAACFDPMTCTFPIRWKGGFVRLGDARHGFMGGATMEGTAMANPTPPKQGDAPTYHGFYRHGKEVIFFYSVKGKQRLATAREDGMDLSPLTKGGPAQWPQWIETKGTLGKQEPFATDTLTVPFENPYGTLFFISGHDFFSDGTAAVCTMTGEVWLVRGVNDKLDKLRWKRFATGLHQPLGLKIIKDKVHVLGRDQVTCLHDLNGDDEADFYECATNAMITSPGGHSFITGLDADSEGRFYFASANQGLCRATASSVEVLATGFRNPNGLGVSPDARFVTSSVQEGDWTPASAICQVEVGKNIGAHFGAGGTKNGQPPEPPLIYLPRGEDNSAGGQCFLSTGAWPTLKGDGNFIHLSSGTGSAWLVMRQQVNDRWQAAAVRISGNFDSGVQGGRFNVRDGHFYVSGMQGWGSYTPLDGCFQRVRFTGGVPMPVGIEARDNGVLLRFDSPLDEGIAAAPMSHFAQCWNYRYSAAYGSPEFSVLRPGSIGHDPLEIRSAQVLDGGKALFLEIPQIVPANQIHLRIGVTKGRAHDVFLTAHALAAPFTAFPGYTVIAKTAHVAPPASLGGDFLPVKWEQGDAGRALHIQAANGLQFAQKELHAKAGERLSLVFENPDVLPHNWVLMAPDAIERVGALANHLIAAPDALARHYVPESADILCHTRVLDPQKKTVIHFTAPAKAGRYPYVCSFPGHWAVMRGILIVE